MNWIPLFKLAEIAKDINTVYTAKRAYIDDVDISEDLLSIELVKTIREVLLTQREDEEITKESDGFHLSVQAYKATSALERKHGDIAIVVSDNDRRVVGTGFYEAKLQSLNGGYPAFNVRQIQKLESSTPRLAIVMHERGESHICDDPFDWNFPGYDRSDYHNNLSLCRALPASWARKFRRLSDAAWQRPPFSFGYHFVTRYLMGPDLDYSRSPEKAIARWVRKTKRASPIVVEISISRSREGHLINEPLLISPGSSQILLGQLEKDVKWAQPEFVPII
jgi:hypothetical protein